MINSKFSSYIPAYSVTGLTALLKNTKNPRGKSFRFYKEDGVFYHNKVLISAGHAYKKSHIKDELEVDLSKSLVLGDSGGFQIATKQLVYTDELRKKIFDWLEYNTNFAMNLDLPAYVSTINKETTDDYFTNQLTQSVDNFKYFEANQSGSTRYFNIIHGRTKDDLDTWYEAVKDLNFTGGWGIGSASVNLFYILQSFFYLYDQGEFEKLSSIPDSIMHILGFSKIKKIIFVSYLQKKLRDHGYDFTLTFDSSSPDQAAGYGRYVFDINVNGTKNLNFNNSEVYNTDSYFPCDCPVCKDVKIKEVFGVKTKKGGFATENYNFVSFHNLYRLIDYKKRLDRVIEIDNPVTFETFFDTKTLDILKMIDKAFTMKGKSFNFIQNNIIKITSSLPQHKMEQITALSPLYK